MDQAMVVLQELKSEQVSINRLYYPTWNERQTRHSPPGPLEKLAAMNKVFKTPIRKVIGYWTYELCKKQVDSCGQ
jgi:hypothetical protein